MNQTERRISGYFGWGTLDIGPIGLIGPIARVGELSDLLSFWMVLPPERQIALPQEILVIEQQFFLAIELSSP